MSKNCSELTCDSPSRAAFMTHSPSHSPSHSPRPLSPSPSPSPLNLACSTSCTANEDPKLAARRPKTAGFPPSVISCLKRGLRRRKSKGLSDSKAEFVDWLTRVGAPVRALRPEQQTKLQHFGRVLVVQCNHPSGSCCIDLECKNVPLPYFSGASELLTGFQRYYNQTKGGGGLRWLLQTQRAPMRTTWAVQLAQ